MAKFKKGDKVVRRASQIMGAWLQSVLDPCAVKTVVYCDTGLLKVEGTDKYWEPYYFDLYEEPQPESMTVTEPAVQQIPGVPDGYRLVRIGAPKKGEWYVDNDGGVQEAVCGLSPKSWAIVESIVPPAPPTPIPTKVKVQLSRYLVGDLTRPSSLRVVECTQENIDSCYFGYRLLGPSETLELEVEV